MTRLTPPAVPLLAAFLLAGCAAVVPTPVAPPPVLAAPETRTLAAEIAARPDLSIFTAQLAASGDALRLSAPAPITVFATQDAAYARLAPDVVPSLLAPDNRAMLDRIVRYHVVDGAIDQAELRRRVEAGGGRTTLVTLAGDPLIVTLTGTTLTLTDGDGDHAYLGAEAARPNGILHPIDGFLAPPVD